MRRQLLAVTLLALASCKRSAPPESNVAPSAATLYEAERDTNVRAETDANVRAALAAEGCTVSRQEHRLFFIRCRDAREDDVLNVDTFERIAQGLPTADERRARAFDFVHRLVTSPAEHVEPPMAKLLLLVRTREYLRANEEMIGDKKPAKPAKVIRYPLPGDLVVLAAIDEAETTRLLDAPTLARWKLDEAKVYAKAIENLDAHPLAATRIESGDPALTVYRVTGAPDENEASRILAPKTRASLERTLGGRAVFAIPDRRQLLAARADDARSVMAMRALAANYARSPLGISAEVFEVDREGKLRVLR